MCRRSSVFVSWSHRQRLVHRHLCRCKLQILHGTDLQFKQSFSALNCHLFVKFYNSSIFSVSVHIYIYIYISSWSKEVVCNNHPPFYLWFYGNIYPDLHRLVSTKVADHRPPMTSLQRRLIFTCGKTMLFATFIKA